MTVLRSRYTLANNKPIDIVPFRILPRKHIFSGPSVDLHTEVWFHSVEMNMVIECKPGIYDGFSIWPPITWLTLGMLNPIMSGIESIFPHDTVCKLRLGTRTQRSKMFAEAHRTAFKQFYADDGRDAWRNVLVKGVHIGARYFKTC